jgi:uroporphyrinogen-III synthase
VAPTVCFGWRSVVLNTANSRALEGRRIVVTRAPGQSRELRERLEELGAEVISLPLIRFLEPENTAGVDQAIRSLEKFDWLIFTSANAVTFFLKRCSAIGSWQRSQHPKIAAVGSATQTALEGEGLQASLVPAEFSGAGLVKEFGPVMTGKSVLLPRSDRASEELPALLRKAGADVTEVIAYRTAGAETIAAGLVEKIGHGLADAVTFFSPSAFHEFQNLMGPEALSNSISQVVFAAVGPVTAEAIRTAGLPVAIEAQEATTASLVSALERYFSNINAVSAGAKRSQGRNA